MGEHIAVNLLWCVPGSVGGTEEYLDRQLRGLPECFDDRVQLYVPADWPALHPELAARFATVSAPFGVHRRVRRIIGEDTWLHRVTKGVALTHHGGGAAPLLANRPYVVTVHDLQYRTYPQYFTVAKRRYLSAVLPRSVHRAACVAVPTEFVRDTVHEAFAVPYDRIAVVPHGFAAPDLSDISAESELRARFQLGDGPVLVYPAITHPHKNHRFLLRAMSLVWRDPDLRLVLIGGEGAAEAEVHTTGDSRVRRLGRVSDADRNGLLAMATAMVFPSQYEGFGAPLVEAMAMGAPVIASDVTCIPSVLGDAGLVRPLHPDAWGQALQEAMARRDELVAAGRRRAAEFSMDASGAALAAAYELAMRGDGSTAGR
jgi:alpha-1,3-rhamnosyl/mannosyltransferase